MKSKKPTSPRPSYQSMIKKSHFLKTSYQQSKTIVAVLASALALQVVGVASENFSTFDSKEDVQKIINFLTSDIADQGITYQGTAGGLKGKKLPLSYYCTPDYWKDYVLLMPGQDGVTIDRYTPGDSLDNSALTATEEAKSLQVERINVHNGCNIYDAATWQIALALAGNDGMRGANGEDLFSLAGNQSTLLKLGYDGNADVPEIGANRGVSSNEAAAPTLTYNDCVVNNARQAYFFRMIPRAYAMEDPLSTDVQSEGWPNNNPYPKICISWQDWLPITGENIWAFLIGPLQTALVRYHGQSCVPFECDAVQNALAILSTFQKMQSKIGAIYFAPAGAISEDQRYKVSVENNMSALAGLIIFKKVLQQEAKQPQPFIFFSNAIEKRNKIRQALTIINTMLYGGRHTFDDNGIMVARDTDGILKFLKEKAWDKEAQGFLLGGEANKPGEEEWLPSKNTVNDSGESELSKAVDVNTWGLAVLGQDFVDHINGDDFGRSYELWQRVKTWSGYWGADHELWGVGYSDLDGNGGELNGDGVCERSSETGILSGEWTAGAINMLRVLITQYNCVANSVTESMEHRNKAKEYVISLQRDHDWMVKHLQSLRTDHYATESEFEAVRPPNYDQLISIPSEGATGKLGYLYASKRYFIPFGWYANPIPSMASTAWAVMLYYNFNPFSMNGDYFANEF